MQNRNGSRAYTEGLSNQLRRGVQQDQHVGLGRGLGLQLDAVGSELYALLFAVADLGVHGDATDQKYPESGRVNNDPLRRFL